jgi:hypothetical protein
VVNKLITRMEQHCYFGRVNCYLHNITRTGTFPPPKPVRFFVVRGAQLPGMNITKLSEKPHERASLLTISRLIAT